MPIPRLGVGLRYLRLANGLTVTHFNNPPLDVNQKDEGRNGDLAQHIGESALLPRRKLPNEERKPSMVTYMAPPHSLVNMEYCRRQYKRTLDPSFTHDPSVEIKGRIERNAIDNYDNFQKNSFPTAILKTMTFLTKTTINLLFKIHQNCRYVHLQAHRITKNSKN